MASIRSNLQAIEQEQAANGSNSANLIPLLESLAGIYQDIGDYEGANLALERARHLVRVHDGLYSLEQAGIVEQMIDNDIEISPGERFAELEMSLSELIRRHPDDPRVVEVLAGQAERDMALARYLLMHGVPPELVINAGYAGTSGLFAGAEYAGTPGLFAGAGFSLAGPFRREPPRTARFMANSMLNRARSGYGSAMAAALHGDSLDVPRLLEIEDHIIQTYYFELMNAGLRHHRQSYANNGRLRRAGIQALTAKLENSRRYPGTPVAVTEARLELADWHLMFHSFGHAMQSYEAAREYLAAEADAAIVAGVFSPESPVPLPAFSPNESVYADAGDVHGYVDVSIEINRYGGARNVEILGHSANASAAIARRLKRHICQSRFRPRFVDGAWLHSDRFRLRYRFSYLNS